LIAIKAHCPFARHYQRYEMGGSLGLYKDKNVIDIGCYDGYGTRIIAKEAHFVWGIDHRDYGSFASYKRLLKKQNMEFIHANFMKSTLNGAKIDVGVAVEIFEHIEDPLKFIERIAGIVDSLFITTPLSDYTKKTPNPEHVLEYSREDFEGTVEKGGFKILDRMYQT